MILQEQTQSSRNIMLGNRSIKKQQEESKTDPLPEFKMAENGRWVELEGDTNRHNFQRY